MPPLLHTHFIDKLAVLNGFLSGVALYPQIYLILYGGVPNTLSELTLWLILLNNVVWFAYAFHRLLVSLLIAAALNTVAAAILLLLI